MGTDKIRIKWVDHFPSVNTTDSFLIKKHVKRRFVEDLNDFLPIYMQKYFWPRALAQIKGKNLIRLFYALPNQPSTLIYIPNSAIEKIPNTISKQKEIAYKYLSDVDSFSSLASKLSGFGRDQFGLNGSPNITELTSWEDYLRLLHIKMGSSFRLVPLRLFGGFIYERSRILWPIAMIKSESSWSTFVARYGYPLGSWCLYQRLPKGKAPFAFRIIRATRWSSFDDITNKDVSNIRKKLKRLPPDQNRPFATALNTITRLAIKNGNPLNFETVSQRAAQTRSNGRLDGSFSFFHNISSNSSAINYWVTKAKGFYSYEKEDGRQNMHHIGNNISKWIDYLCYLDRIGKCPGSMLEVDRKHHLAYEPSSDQGNDGFPTYMSWLMEKTPSKNVRHKAFSILRLFFYWIIDTEGLNIPIPIRDIDIPPLFKKPLKSYRPALTQRQWVWIRDILLNRPPKYYEGIGFDANNKMCCLPSPTLKTYALIRLELGIRDIQARYLDMNKVLGADGFVISGDKNIGRKYLQIVPYFDPELKKNIEACIEWQKQYNPSAVSVWYGGNENSPFGKIKPLLRLIRQNPKPISFSTTSKFMVRVFLKYQKEAGLKDNDQIVFAKDGSPLDMSAIDPDNITQREILNLKTAFDLHSLRVTAATIWYEAGVPLEIIQEFITGHATITMLLHYVKIRDADRVMKDAFNKLMENRTKIKSCLVEDIDKTLDSLKLSSRILRNEDIDLDGAEALKNIPGSFWRFFHYGICPAGACPNGLDGRCGICPLLISGPPFKAGIAVQLNMAVSQAMITGLEMRNVHSNQTNREAMIQSQVQEITGWLGWLRHIENLEVENTINPQDKIVLYSSTEYNPLLMKTSPVIHELQRCVDIRHCPDVWTENTYYKARAFLMTIISKLPKDKDPYSVVNQLTPDKTIEYVATYFLRLIKAGKTFDEIESVFTDENYNLAVDGISNVFDYSLRQFELNDGRTK